MSVSRVAVDLGANSGRVAVGRIIGGQLSFEIVHRFPNGGVTTPNGLMWDFPRLLGEIEVGIKSAGESGPVASIGVDSWGVDYGIIGPDSQLLCSPFHYRDSRVNDLMEHAQQTRASEIFVETGLQFLPFNTLFQLEVHRRQAPELFLPGNFVLMVPDLIHWCLGGRIGIERTNASTTQFYNPVSGKWSDTVLADMPEVAAVLPPILDAGTDLGPLRADLRALPGLSDTRLIAPATHDTGSAVLGTPMDDPKHCAFVISGTWTLVGLELSAPLISDRVRMANFSNEVGVNSTVRFLKNVMGLWIFQECLRAWNVADIDALINASANQIQSVGAFDPDSREFLEPGLDMPMRVCHAVPGLANDPVAISAAIFKSLARKTAEVIRQAALLAAVDLHAVNLVGGGSQNRLLNQLIANEAGIPVLAGPVEATLIGNLLKQFESAGELPGTIREVIQNSYALETYTPAR